MYYYVYVLLSLRDKRLYIGFTTNLKNRLTEHARGKVRSTKERRPLKLIHYEYFIDKADTKAREVFLKSGFGRSGTLASKGQAFCGYFPPWEWLFAGSGFAGGVPGQGVLSGPK